MLDTATQLRWIRPAQQVRSRETCQRLMDSAEELMAEKGFADVPVAEIARRAGFSVGAVYARFRDKAGILRCLRERFWGEVRATVDAALTPARWEGATVPEVAQETIAFMVQVHRDRIGILREIMGSAQADPEVGARLEELIAHVCQKLTRLLLARADEMVRVCGQLGVPLGCGTAYWELPHLLDTVQWVRDGHIGELTGAAIPGRLPLEVSGSGCVQLTMVRLLTGMEVVWAEGWALPAEESFTGPPDAKPWEIDGPAYGRLGLSGGIVCDIPAPDPLPAPWRSERIAVVGSGPAGITCAHDLAKMGFKVTLLEAEDQLGGMLRYGIPDYRLPPDILDREIEQQDRRCLRQRPGDQNSLLLTSRKLSNQTTKQLSCVGSLHSLTGDFDIRLTFTIKPSKIWSTSHQHHILCPEARR